MHQPNKVSFIILLEQRRPHTLQRKRGVSRKWRDWVLRGLGWGWPLGDVLMTPYLIGSKQSRPGWEEVNFRAAPRSRPRVLFLWKTQNKDKGGILCLKIHMTLWRLKSQAASLCHRLLPSASRQQWNVPFSLRGFQTAMCLTVCDFNFIYLFIIFFFWPCHTVCWILVPWPGIEPEPQQWKHRILTTGLPVNSQSVILRIRSLSSTILLINKTSS